MKKPLLLLLILLPLLSGCGPFYAQRREVEQLRLVETFGLDRAPGGVLLSLASSSGPGEEEAACYSAPGASVSDAMEQLRLRSLEEPLFCGHLQHILLGEDLARQGIEGLLAYACRSSDLRLDMPVYLLLGSTAQEAMTEVGSNGKGIADALNALEEAQGDAQRLSTAGTILRDLDRQGSALVRTLRLAPASEAGEDGGVTVVSEGFGVLVDGRLREQLGPEDAVAAALLTDSLQPCPLVLRDAGGRTVTLELQDATASLLPVWAEDGRLDGLDITVKVRAAVLEIDGFDRVADESYRDALTARLETELSQRIGHVLRLSRSLEADFLGLGRKLEQAEPLRGRGLDRALGPLLPSLSLSVSVQGELSHAGDMN